MFLIHPCLEDAELSKGRINRNEVRRLRQKQAYSDATRVRLLAEQLRNQADLDTMLLPVEDVQKRLKLYEFIRPFLKFKNPEFPSTIRPAGIILCP